MHELNLVKVPETLDSKAFMHSGSIYDINPGGKINIACLSILKKDLQKTNINKKLISLLLQSKLMIKHDLYLFLHDYFFLHKFIKIILRFKNYFIIKSFKVLSATINFSCL